MAKYKILITKKIPSILPGEKLPAEFEIIEKEFIHIRPVQTDQKIKELISGITNLEKTTVSFTSQHAVRFASIHFHPHTPVRFPEQWKIFCLSGITREMVVRNFSVAQIASTADNALELANSIIKTNMYNKVVFFLRR